MRMGARTLAVASATAALFAAAHCGSEEATQIIVTVEATAAECKVIQQTVVRVGSFDDRASVATEKAGCDQATNRIGEFVLVPKGANDSEVQFQVVTGIARNAEACRADDRVDCIFARRVVRFVPQETVRVTVLMAGACRGKTCEANETCDAKGDCVSAQATCEPPSSCVDASTDVALDTPQSRCETSGCLSNRTALCRADGVCEANCGLDMDCNLECPPGIACVFNCGAANACATVKCGDTSTTCEVSCKGTSACNTVECRADTCKILCDRVQDNDGTRGCDKVTLGAKTSGILDCAESSCGDVTCPGPKACECPRDNPSGSCNDTNNLCGSCDPG
jgi:hypothetical protein